MSAGERWRICPCSTASLSIVKSFSAYPGWTTLCTNQELSVSFRRGTKLASGETTTSRCSDLCFLAIHPASTNYWLYSESLNKPLTRPLERTEPAVRSSRLVNGREFAALNHWTFWCR